jgi:hypothetical protein
MIVGGGNFLVGKVLPDARLELQLPEQGTHSQVHPTVRCYSGCLMH